MPTNFFKTLAQQIVKTYNTDKKKSLLSPKSQAIVDLEAALLSNIDNFNFLDLKIDARCFLQEDGSRTTYGAVYDALSKISPKITPLEKNYEDFQSNLGNRETITFLELLASVLAEPRYFFQVVEALKRGNGEYAHLFADENSQANFTGIVQAGEHAEAVAEALSLLNRNSLFLAGQDAPANRAAIVQAGEHAEGVAVALIIANWDGLLADENAPANQAAIIQAGKHAEAVARALHVLNVSNLLVGENAPANRAAIVQKFSSPTDASEQRKKLYRMLNAYPRIITKDSGKNSLALNEAQATKINEAMDLIERRSPNLITLENYNLLLKECEDALLLFAQALTNQLTVSDFTWGALAKLRCFSGLSELNEDHFKLYQRFSKAPHEMTIKTLKGIVQLSPAEAKILSDQKSEVKTITVFNESQSGLLPDILTEHDNIVHLYDKIPREQRTALPEAHDFESSMRDDFIKIALERIESLKEELDLKSMPNEQLEKIEIQIRQTLLSAIKRELESDKTNSSDPAKIAVLDEKINFIEKNLDVLADRTASSDIINKAIVYFSEATSTAQTAWRAYEPNAQTVHWPNLLTAPNEAEKNKFVFSTSASSSEALTLNSASDEIRRLAATCFLASEKYPQMKEDFIYAIAEIRRAHNNKASEIDNPSCQPGTVSRLGAATSKHPKFSAEKSPEDLKSIVENVIRSRAQPILNDMGEGKVGAEAGKLLFAINLFSHECKKDILNDKGNIELHLVATDDDVKTDEKRAAWIQEIKKIANDFLQKLVGVDGAALHNAIMDELQKKNIIPAIEEINYLIAKDIANLSTLMSLPQNLLNNYQADVKEPTEVRGIKDDFCRESHKCFNGIDIVVINDLSDALNFLLERLQAPQANAWKDRPVLTHEKIKDIVAEKIKGLTAEQSAVITVDQVVSILKTMFPNTYPSPLGQPLANAGLFSRQTTTPASADDTANEFKPDTGIDFRTWLR